MVIEVMKFVVAGYPYLKSMVVVMMDWIMFHFVKVVVMCCSMMVDTFVKTVAFVVVAVMIQSTHYWIDGANSINVVVMITIADHFVVVDYSVAEILVVAEPLVSDDRKVGTFDNCLQEDRHRSDDEEDKHRSDDSACLVVLVDRVVLVLLVVMIVLVMIVKRLLLLVVELVLVMMMIMVQVDCMVVVVVVADIVDEW